MGLGCFVSMQDPPHGMRGGLLSMIVRFMRQLPHHMSHRHTGLTRVTRSHAVPPSLLLKHIQNFHKDCGLRCSTTSIKLLVDFWFFLFL